MGKKGRHFLLVELSQQSMTKTENPNQRLQFGPFELELPTPRALHLPPGLDTHRLASVGSILLGEEVPLIHRERTPRLGPPVERSLTYCGWTKSCTIYETLDW